MARGFSWRSLVNGSTLVAISMLLSADLASSGEGVVVLPAFRCPMCGDVPDRPTSGGSCREAQLACQHSALLHPCLCSGILDDVHTATDEIGQHALRSVHGCLVAPTS
eukprot:654989-Amphidinium_carterae.1